MTLNNQWFEIVKYKDYLFVIREKLSDIDPRFHSDYTNLYLLLGSYNALLIDTGAGLFTLKSVVDDLIGSRELKIINTHSHWDHSCGNYEFDEIYIHEIESLFISRPINITNLKDSPKKIVQRYDSRDFNIPPALIINSLNNGDSIDLGELKIEVIHTPGHSPGSISLLSNKNELFTGDLAHYGAVYLPKKKNLPEVLSSISKLIDLCNKKEKIEIYPSHEEYGVGKELLIELYNGINNIDNLWDTKLKDNFLRSWIIEDNKFKYVISRI